MAKKLILAVVAAVIVLGVGVGLAVARVPLFGAEQEAQTPTALPGGMVESQARSDVVAEAVVVPVQHATLSMAANGIVAQVLVGENDTVQAGEVILRLRDAHQQAALAQAEAGLAAARAQLAGLQAGARDQEIAVARAGLEAAQARQARLEEDARQADVAAARASLAAAEAALQRLYDGPDDFTRIAAEAELANAEAALRQAQAAYDRIAAEPDVTMRPESLALEQATNQYDAARARYDALFAEPDADAVAQVQAQIKQAQANLDRLLTPVTANELAEVAAGTGQAQAQLDLLLAGSRAEEIAAAEAAVAKAAAAVQAAQAALADTELRAPFAGVVAALQVKAGEQVVAGMPLAQLADLAVWQVETDDLTELDIARVNEGDAVIITFDALPGLEIAGRVVRIKPIGQENQGDVTYTVVVQPDEQHPDLRWNMTAVVTLP